MPKAAKLWNDRFKNKYADRNEQLNMHSERIPRSLLQGASIYYFSFFVRKGNITVRKKKILDTLKKVKNTYQKYPEENEMEPL